MNGFTEEELCTMLGLLYDGQKNLPAFNDGITAKEMQIIIVKITEELRTRKDND